MFIRKKSNVIEPKSRTDSGECVIIVVDPDQPELRPGQFNTSPIQPSNAGAEGTGLLTPLPPYTMTETTMMFRMDARTAWMKWAFSLLNYSISLNGGLPGTDQVKGRVHKTAVTLGDFIVPYYGLTAGNLLATSLIAINDIGMHYVEAIKAGRPTIDIVASWDQYVKDIAKLFNELNPNNWPESLIYDIFGNIVKAWQDQLTARHNGDIIADEIAIDYLNKIVISGVKEHMKHGYSSLADLFSRGIIAQFPTMFAE
jgi:hypothetical protein